jgi:hypothetical protein
MKKLVVYNETTDLGNINTYYGLLLFTFNLFIFLFIFECIRQIGNRCKRSHEILLHEYESCNTKYYTIIKKNLSSEICSICLEDLKIIEENNEIVVLKCSHLFHKKCIDEWINVQHVCPLCKENI